MADVAMRFGLFVDDNGSSKLDRFGAAADSAGGKMRSANVETGKYGKGLESAGERADKSEARILGMKDTVDGVATVMKGPGKQGIAAYLQGWADLASGLANFVVPALAGVKVSTLRSAASTVVSTVAQKAAAAASKAWAAVQWVLNAALSANPIGIVVVALVAIAAALVIAWKRSDTFRAIVTTALHAVGAAAGWLWEKAIKPAFAAISGALSAAVGWFRALPGQIVGVFKSAGSWLLGHGKAVIDGLKNGLVAGWDAAWGWIKAVPGRIIGVYANAAVWLYEKGRAVITGLWNGLKNVWATTSTWLAGRGRAIIDTYKNAGTWLLQTGKDVIGGLWSGFKSAMGDVGKILGDVKDRIVGGLKKLFGINSPSTVMAGLGGHMITGLIKGLLTESGALARTAKGIGATVLDNVGHAGLGPGGVLLSKLFGGGGSSSSNVSLGQRMAAAYGWTGAQWTALRNLWQGESGWNNNAQNPTSTAYGIAQFLNSTWATVGATKTSDPAAQIAAGMQYVRQVYGDPANALSKWLGRSPHWYGSGMDPTVFSRPTVIGVGERGPETVTVTPHRGGTAGGSSAMLAELQALRGAVRRLAEQPVIVQMDGRPIARAVRNQNGRNSSGW